MIEIGVKRDQKFLYLIIDGISYNHDDERTSVLPVGLSGPGDGVGLYISPSSKVAQLLLLNSSGSQKRDTEDILDGLAELTKYEGKALT